METVFAFLLKFWPSGDDTNSKVLRGAALAFAGAFLAYLVGLVGQMEQSATSLLLAAGLSVLLNIVRQNTPLASAKVAEDDTTEA